MFMHLMHKQEMQISQHQQHGKEMQTAYNKLFECDNNYMSDLWNVGKSKQTF